MSRHILKGIATFIIVMLLTALAVAPVAAFEARSGDTVAIPSGEVVNDDLYIGAQTINIDGTVSGDLWAGGTFITLNGVIKGGVVCVGQTVIISADVGRTVRVAGQTVSISGNIDGDLIVGGTDVYIASTATIKGDLVFGAQNMRIDGVIEGDIKGGGGVVTIGAETKGSVDISVESLTVLPAANINGDLTYTSGKEADIQSGAKIGGKTSHNPPPSEDKSDKASPFAPFSGVPGKIIGFLMAVLTGFILVLLAPRRLMSITDSMRSKIGPSAGWGAVVLFATPIAAILVCITIVGIPVGLIALALYGIALYLAQIPVGLLIGRLILGRFRNVEGKAMMVAALALGLLIISLLTLIPYVGFVIRLAVMLFGLGAAVVSVRQRKAEVVEITEAAPTEQ